MIKKEINGRNMDETKEYSILLKEGIWKMKEDNSDLKRLSMLQLLLAELLFQRDQMPELESKEGLRQFFSCFFLLEDDLEGVRKGASSIRNGISSKERVDKFLYRRLMGVSDALDKAVELSEWLNRFFCSVNQDFYWDNFEGISLGETKPWTFFENLYELEGSMNAVGIEIDLDKGCKNCIDFLEALYEDVVDELNFIEFESEALDIELGYLLTCIGSISKELIRGYEYLKRDDSNNRPVKEELFSIEIDYGVMDFIGVSNWIFNYQKEDYVMSEWNVEDKVYKKGKVIFNHINHLMMNTSYPVPEYSESIRILKEMIMDFPDNSWPAEAFIEQVHILEKWMVEGDIDEDIYHLFNRFINCCQSYVATEEENPVFDKFYVFERSFKKEFFGGFRLMLNQVVDKLSDLVSIYTFNGNIKNLFEIFVGLRGLVFLDEADQREYDLRDSVDMILSKDFEGLDSSLYIYEELPF